MAGEPQVAASGAQPPAGKPARIIGGFELLEKIGQGGMGAVFKARQVSLDRIVALKILPPSIAKDQTFTQRFLREARACAKLSHPNIVLGIDVGQDAATQLWYFAMEFVDGRSTRQVLVERKVIPEQEALRIVRDIAKALECARENGFVHRDVKPDNILLTSSGEAKLADLGLARQAREDASLTQSGQAIGTPFYMAPEQIRGEGDNLDIRADLYGLGATLFHLVTGRPPFEGATAAAIMAKHLTEPPPLAHRANPAVSEATSRLIQRLMQKEKERRFQTPVEVVQHIEKIMSGTLTAGQRARTTGPRDGVRATGARQPTGEREAAASGARGRRSLAGLYIGLAVVVMALVAVAVFLGIGKEPTKAEKGPAPRAPSSPIVEQPKAGETTKGPAEDELRAKLTALLSAAQELEKAQPDEYREAQRKYEDLIAQAKGSPLEGEFVPKAQAACAQLQQRWQKAADAAWQEVEQKAATLVAANDYDGALKLYAEMPPGLADLLNAKAAERKEALRKEGEEKLKPSLEAAEEASKNAEPQKGLDALAKVEGIKLAPLSDQVAELKKRLQEELADAAELKKKRLRIAAEKRLGEHLERFDAALLEKCDVAAAREAAAAAQGDAGLKPHCEAQAGALSEIVKLFEDVQNQEAEALKALVGKVLSAGKDKGVVKKVEAGVITLTLTLEGPGGKATAQKAVKVADLTAEQRAEVFKGVKLPDTPAGKVVAAILKMRQGGPELADAEELLKSVPDFALTAHYTELVRIKRLGAAEVAAEKAWPALELAAKAPCTEPEQGRALQARLREWDAAYGTTKFSETKKPQLGEWAAKAERATVVNLVANGDFESGNLDGWRGSLGHAKIVDGGRGSAKALQVVGDGTVQYPFSAEPGVSYLVSAWVKTPGEAGGSLSVDTPDSQGHPKTDLPLRLSAQNADWAQISFVAKATRTEHLLSVWVGPHMSYRLLVDDLRVERATRADGTPLSVLTQGAQPFGENLYRVVKDRMPWEQARAYCEQLGAHLAVITSAQENAFLHRLVGEAGVSQAWVGRRKGTGWVTGERSDYDPPMEGAWRSQTAPLVTPGPNGALAKLVTADAGESHAFICEWEKAAGIAARTAKPGPAAPPEKVVAAAETKSKPVPPGPKLPVPNREALAESERRVKDLFREEYQRKGAAERTALARKLLSFAEASRDDGAACYVALREARDVAVSAGDLETALVAVDALADRFVVDGAELKIIVLSAVVRAATTTEAAEKACDATLSLLDQLVKDEQLDSAVKLISPLEDLARRTTNPELAKTIQARARDVRTQQADWARVKPHLDRLKDNPDDLDAALAVGKYYVASKGDWERALPLLAKCSATSLKEAAAKDLANPEDPAARAALGDLWFALSENEAGAFKAALQGRAKLHYDKALPGLSGAAKGKVEKRLGELDRLVTPRTTLPAGCVLHLDFEDTIPAIHEGREALLLRDRSGAGNQAFLESGKLVDGPKGKCVVIEERAAIKMERPLAVGEEWTIACHLNLGTAWTPGQRSLTTNGPWHHHVLIRSGGILCSVAESGTIRDSPASVAALRGWHHLAAVGKGGETIFYIDGKEVGRTRSQEKGPIMIVGNYISGDQPLRNQMDDFLVFRAALTPDVILLLARR